MLPVLTIINIKQYATNIYSYNSYIDHINMVPFLQVRLKNKSTTYKSYTLINIISNLTLETFYTE